jgi:hypothetical protein
MRRKRSRTAKSSPTSNAAVTAAARPDSGRYDNGGRAIKLEFLLTPTSDLKASLALYRDGLGFTEVWREEDAALTVVDGPSEIPGGFLAAYQDPGGAVIYVMDQSTDQ